MARKERLSLGMNLPTSSQGRRKSYVDGEEDKNRSTLQGASSVASSMHSASTTTNQRAADLLIVGVQEVSDMKKWRNVLMDRVTAAYSLIAFEQLGQIAVAVFVWSGASVDVSQVRCDQVACGVANMMKNKGGVGVSLLINEHYRLLLVNCHLAAHAHKIRERNEDFQRIRQSLFKHEFFGRGGGKEEEERVGCFGRWLHRGDKDGGGGGGSGGGKGGRLHRAKASGPHAAQYKSMESSEDASSRIYEPFSASGAGKSDGRRPMHPSSLPASPPAPSPPPSPPAPAPAPAPAPPLTKKLFSNKVIDSSPPSQDVELGKDDVMLSSPTSPPHRPPRPLANLPDLERRGLLRCLPEVGPWDATKHHHVTLWLGDLNYRVDAPRRMVDRLLELKMLEVMESNDQLTRERVAGRAFRHFEEAPLNFLPTFKFDKGTDNYDSSVKQRVPSWTDRVLWKVHRNLRSEQRRQRIIKCLAYKSVTRARLSDHKPVVAVLDLRIPESSLLMQTMYESVLSYDDYDE